MEEIYNLESNDSFYRNLHIKYFKDQFYEIKK